MSRFFATLVARLMVLTCVALLTVAVPAQASSVTWNVDVSGSTMAAHGTIGGGFTVDPGPSGTAYQSSISNWNITAAEPASVIENQFPDATNPMVFAPGPHNEAMWTGPSNPPDYVKFDKTVWFGTPGESSYIEYKVWLYLPLGTDLLTAGSCGASVSYDIDEYQFSGSLVFPTWTHTKNFSDFSYNWGSGATGTLSSEPVPLPSTLLLLATGLLGLMARRHRRTQVLSARFKGATAPAT